MSIRASAPGKVLICGGYLVVEAPNIGLSLGVTARFSTVVKNVEKAKKEAGAPITIIVNSPQFKTAFEFAVTVGDEVAVEQKAGPQSPFLFYGVLYSVASALGSGGVSASTVGDVTKVELDLLASNDFYSQRNYLEEQGKPVTVANLRSVPDHCPLVGAVSKTGLGSSAAMTTSFVACLLKVFDNADDTERVHRVSQVAHSVAQGKIGSGFDVYTATYGTSIYRRFPAAKAECMMDGGKAPTAVAPALLETCVDLSKSWLETTPFTGLPAGVKLILADIHEGGSGTPGMVAKVMAWRKSVAGTADNLWDRLGAANVAYVSHLQKLVATSQEDSKNWEEAVMKLGELPSSKWGESGIQYAADLSAAQGLALSCRGMLREMGEVAGVEIEPTGLTQLLNDTAALPGVIAAGCPGAGGYDAVFALVLGDHAVAKVEAFWENYQGKNVCPLLVREDPRGVQFD